MPARLLAEHVASTFVLVLHGWMECAEPMPASHADATLRRLVLPVVCEALGA